MIVNSTKDFFKSFVLGYISILNYRMSVKLRVLEKKDNQQITKLMNSKRIWDNLKDYIPYPYQIEDANTFIDLTRNQSPTNSFAIILDDNELCGVISLVPQNDVYRMTAELGYWIGEEYWGRGIATKAIGLITEYGFNQLNLERIYAGIFEFNKASMKVLEKNGYKCEGVLRSAIVKNNVICDEHMYAKLKSD